ncbi:hypothetical protein [Leptolyngbya sp. 7M]|uniref:hypothetical protein n=1 Tax=Leptolyngbya sp. 7M TaxID=2812896 RepID=UPI001B8A99A2|nr:hypothetical protein [Leptolyngbya sp. 7M]QYO67592.1 hypothetical protein JVX88_12815 [Leptolyngbya sp. 7M]
MSSLNLSLPEPIAEALVAYGRDRGIESPAEVVQAALEAFLLQQGYLASSPPKRVRLTPCSQGSGFKDTSANHDAILAEAIFVQSFPQE